MELWPRPGACTFAGKAAAGEHQRDGRQKAFENSRGGRGAEARLKELQSLLGLIHDCDITIEHLRGKKGAEGILERENTERDALFKKFAAAA